MLKPIAAEPPFKYAFTIHGISVEAGSFRLPQCREAGAGGGGEDRLGVDAVGAVEIGDVAGLAKAVDAERDDRGAGDGAPGHDNVAGWKSPTVTRAAPGRPQPRQ